MYIWKKKPGKQFSKQNSQGEKITNLNTEPGMIARRHQTATTAYRMMNELYSMYDTPASSSVRSSSSANWLCVTD